MFLVLPLKTKFFSLLSFNFDVFGEELYPTLAAGASLHIPQSGERESFSAFLALSRREEITIWNLPSPYWHALVDETDAKTDMGALRQVTVGSDKTAPDKVATWLERFPNIPLRNAYGPTEATITATVEKISKIDKKDQRVPIGHPIANTRVYVMDSNLQPALPGVAGELVIGGSGVAMGYLAQSARTAAVFVPNPFGPPGSRLYRTGDLVRFLSDGRLDIFGRIDNQIKLRGFRIETGELENVLLEHAHVQKAVARVRGEGGNARLVVYLEASPMPDLSDLNDHMRKQLPAFMIPDVILPVEQIPRTINDKIDNKALAKIPLPDSSPTDSRPPQTRAEKVLANIWEELLELEKTPMSGDDFFALGGHSLVAARVVSRIRATMGVELSLGAFFENTTLERLAIAIEQARAVALPAIEPRAAGELLHLSFAQERLWFLYQLEGKSSSYNMSAALRLSGRLDEAALEGAFSDLCARHEILGSRFENREGQPHLRIQPIDFRLGRHDYISAPDPQKAARDLIASETLYLFDLGNEPLLRASLARVDEDEHILVINIHHIISDGWSVGIIIHELATFYRARVKNEAVSLPSLPIQYTDFAGWQREWLSGENLERQIAYWRNKLADLSILELPTDRPRPPVLTFKRSQLQKASVTPGNRKTASNLQ